MANWGQGAQGAAGGAMTGAAVGSVVPGIGTAAGAIGGGIIGGIAGLFGGGGGPKYDDALRKRLMELEQQYGQAPPAAQANYSDFRQNQRALVSQQEAMARGEGPSAAALQMREAMDRAVAAQGSLAAGAVGRGVNGGAALRNAANTTAAIQSQGARDMALARVNEQLGAMNQLGLTLHGARGADEGVNMFNAQQQNMQANAIRDAQLRALGAAGGTYQGQQVGLGSQILAGGASALPGMLMASGAGQRQPTSPQPQAQSMQPQLQPGAWNPMQQASWGTWNPQG